MPRMFCYGRASTDSQKITLLAQEEITRNYFKLRQSMNESIEYGGWFCDADTTSKIDMFERPKAAEILVQAQEGDAIVVSNFDRAFRSVTDFDHSFRISNEAGIGLIILDIDVNTDSPVGRAVMRIIAVIKELEREEIARRTKEALQYNIRHMKPCKSRCPVGWTLSEVNGKPEYIPSEIAQRAAFQIVALVNEQGLSLRDIEKIAKKEWEPIPWRGNKCDGWSQYNVMRFYVAAICGFPKLLIPELPPFTHLMYYLALSGGRPPQLEVDAVSMGRLYTLPPIEGPPPIVVPPILYRGLKPAAFVCRDAEMRRDEQDRRRSSSSLGKPVLRPRPLIPTPRYPRDGLTHQRRIYLALQSRNAAQSSHTHPVATPASPSSSLVGTG